MNTRDGARDKNCWAVSKNPRGGSPARPPPRVSGGAAEEQECCKRGYGVAWRVPNPTARGAGSAARLRRRSGQQQHGRGAPQRRSVVDVVTEAELGRLRGCVAAGRGEQQMSRGTACKCHVALGADAQVHTPELPNAHAKQAASRSPPRRTLFRSSALNWPLTASFVRALSSCGRRAAGRGTRAGGHRLQAACTKHFRRPKQTAYSSDRRCLAPGPPTCSYSTLTMPVCSSFSFVSAPSACCLDRPAWCGVGGRGVCMMMRWHA